MKERNNAIDILKGFGILLVLVAHSLGGVVSQFAYTFHMPLFFIITGLFIVSSKDSKEISISSLVIKDVKRLLLPLLFTTGVIVICTCVLYNIGCDYVKNPISILWDADGVEEYDRYILLLGNMWFLFALFWGKFFFYLIYRASGKRLCYFYCTVAGFISVYSLQWFLVPLRFQMGMMILPYICVGFYMKQYGGINKSVSSIVSKLFIIMWITNILYFHLLLQDLYIVRTYFPYIFLSVGGTLFFYVISNYIQKYSKLLTLCLSFLGRNSLLLVCIPTIETYCFPFNVILSNDLPLRFLFVLLCKVGWCCIAFLLCFNSPLLKRVYSIK